MSYKLFIPGPVQVSDKTYKAMTTPLVGHRSNDFVALYNSIQPRLQKLFSTQDPVFLSTSSAWGVMEGSIRNLTNKKVLSCMCGAFSDKWLDVSRRCGKQADGYQVEWGKHIDPETLRKHLATGAYDVVTLIHNETSTGVLNPLEDIMAVIREFPEVISVVDTVSSFTTQPILKDTLGIDVMLTGTQKALAMPPGLALLSVSRRALERAKKVEGRGYYFDFLEFLSNHEKGMTPSTPAIPLINALKSRIEDIEAEGIENRFARHRRLNGIVHRWAEANGFILFPEKKYASISLSCIANNRKVDLGKINKQLKERYKMVIDTGYGKLKDLTFRISNMGDETDETMQELLDNLNVLLKEVS
jgi:aspartate aminotransferase-like enzyme